jgi:branched-chain amino acid transport system permease protein
MNYWVLQTMNAVSFAGVLFLLSSGFSLVFGLMRIPNMAHGALFMVGAFVVAWAILHGLPFLLAVLASAAAVAALGFVIERWLLRRVAGRELAQLLASLGAALIVADACKLLWGAAPIQVDAPRWLQGSTSFGDLSFPTYRLFVTGISLALAAALMWVDRRTLVGARVRAAVDDPLMARAMGIRVTALYSIVFAAGSALVGLAGALGAPLFSATLGLDLEMLPLALVVVILGGVGSLGGAVVASLITGFIQVFGQALFAAFAYVVLFLPMVVMLAVRPQGLYGRVAV